jgi:hypothetical protein
MSSDNVIDYSYGVTKERSSIKPDVPGSQTNTDNKPELKFKYNTKTYDSYRENGFLPPEFHKRKDKQEIMFLQAVDISKGKIQVEVTRMFRIHAIDYSSEKREFKDYLYFESNWYAKNWREEEIRVITHVEGKNIEQTKKLAYGPRNETTGRVEAYYEKGQARDHYSIPFTKKAVDHWLSNGHPFGADSVNITDPSRVIFYGKISNVLGVADFRCKDYTYVQFANTPEWKDFVQLAVRPGGPALRIPNNQAQFQQQQQQQKPYS